MQAESEVAKWGASVVPWALPNESIPMRIWWHKGFKFDKLRISLPDGFRCVEIVNAPNAKVWKNQVDISSFVEVVSSDTNYIGLVVKSGKLQEELDRLTEVVAIFSRGGKVFEKQVIRLRTLRPRLSLLRAPDKLQVKPGETKLKLPLEVKYTGFGDIKVNLVATYEGQIVSQGQSLVFEVMRRLYLERDKPTHPSKGMKGEVSSTLVNNVTKEIVERLESGNISTEELDAEAVRYLKDWLSEFGSERIRQVLYAKVEDLLVGVLHDLILRNPIDGIRLDEPRTKLMTNIRFPINDIILQVKYRDLVGNRYEPVRIKVVVEYLGNLDKPVPIDIPITITKWEHEPIMNVAGGSS